MTILAIAEQQGIQPASVRKKIERKGFPRFDNEQELPEDVIRAISGRIIEKTKAITPIQKESGLKRKKTAIPKSKVLQIVQFLPLPMLGLSASYGVYFFASQFVPGFVAIIEAAAFELTYIGLSAMTGLSDKQKIYARRVCVMAVIVSVIYNTLASAIHQQPGIIQNLNWFWFWALAIVHGAPLATLAYFVADLIFHQKR